MSDPGDGEDYLECGMPAPVLRPPTTVAGRYHLGKRLGAGVHGVVHAAADSVGGGEVAIKLLVPGTEPGRIRREVVALRGLRVDGVVQFIDAGIAENGQFFIVTEFIDGKHFPTSPTPWRRLKGLLCSLLLALHRIHHFGLLHLDLKPQNVLVTAEGKVVVVDFGLAGGPGVGDTSLERARAGTAQYRAPEQVASVRSDLYAVGVMVYHALYGRLPQRHSTGAVGRTAHPEFNADVAASQLLQALLCPDPEGRPQSAEQALDKLDPTFESCSLSYVPTDPRAWTDLFTGPERICHKPTRAATLLRSCTGSNAKLVPAELRAWIRLGVATRRGQQFEVHDAPLQRMLPWSGASNWLGNTGTSRSLEAGEMIDMAQGLIVNGRLEEGFRFITTQLALLRHATEAATREHQLLSLLAKVALDQRTVPAFELALYELGRCHKRTSEIEALELLLQSATYCEQGKGRRCLDAIYQLDPFADPSLERRRHGVLLRCVARYKLGQERVRVREACAWVTSVSCEWPEEGLDAYAHAWRGGLAYRNGEYAVALQCHLRASTLGRALTTRLAGKLDAASAFLELGRYDDALELAHQVCEQACKHQLPLYEGRGEWLLRAVAYRSNTVVAVDHALLAAVKELNVPYLAGLIHVTESAIAWRLGEAVLACRLARCAEQHFEAAGWRCGLVLARALRLSNQAAPNTEEIGELCRDVCAHPIRDVDWQILALCHPLLPSASYGARAAELVKAVRDPHRRREVLAPVEVMRGAL